MAVVVDAAAMVFVVVTNIEISLSVLVEVVAYTEVLLLHC